MKQFSNTFKPSLVLALFLLATMADLQAGPPQARGVAKEVLLGEQLFQHNWARPAGWTGAKPLGAGGDGLGPMFNDVSCIACHSEGGVGGSGGNEHNVELLSMLIPAGSSRPQRSGILKRAQRVHPNLSPQMETVMLHRFGFGSGDETTSYDNWRDSLLGIDQPDRRPLSVASPHKMIDGVSYRLSQRNTSALWGAAEIERLRRTSGEKSRRSILLKQNGSSSGVSGRLPRTSDGRTGWYGWRGHVAGLHEFVLNACANEMGLTVTGHQQPDNPFPEGPRGRRRKTPPALDLTGAQVRALTRYVISLPRPEQVFPSDLDELRDVYGGEWVFDGIGCGDCHARQLGRVKGVYSDFLLHDMGTSLSDPSSAFPPPPEAGRGGQRRRRAGGYSGGSSSPPPVIGPTPTRSDSLGRTRLTQEWRTPPLWGVADTAPYLHDGRAETLDEAIRLHSGEAARAAEAYRYLADAQRSQLLTFLGTLRASQQRQVVVSAVP